LFDDFGGSGGEGETESCCGLWVVGCGLKYRVFVVEKVVFLRQVKKETTDEVGRESFGRFNDYLRKAVEGAQKRKFFGIQPLY